MANEEPRSAWRTLLDSGLFGGNSEQTALRADHIFDGNLNSDLLRYALDKIRTFFEENSEEN